MNRTGKMTAVATLMTLAFVAPTAARAADTGKSTTESMKTMVSDSWVTTKTKIALIADSRVPGRSVSVETKDRMVFLRGKVETDAQKQAAEQIARGIDGVQAVRNELQVVPSVRAVRNDTTYDNPRMSQELGRPARARHASMRAPTATQAEGDIRMAQEKLKDKGFDPGPLDGLWGPRTASAVGEYQRTENMTVTRRLDRDTLAKLEATPAKPQNP